MTSSADLSTLGKINSLTNVTSSDTDKILIKDTSDSDNLKTALVSDVVTSRAVAMAIVFGG